MRGFAKSMILFLVIGILVGGYFLFKNMQENKRIEEIKNGWYIEVIHDDPINVRDKASTDGKTIGKVSKGEIYKVLNVDTESGTSYFWYKIEYKNTIGWVASGKKIHWVKDVNNPNDIQAPSIKFEDDVYKVVSIDDINYKHLTILDDRNDYKITHQIYHEVKPYENINQYWILYTVTDKSGKSDSKMQKIEFDIAPDESEVLDFATFKR